MQLCDLLLSPPGRGDGEKTLRGSRPILAFIFACVFIESGAGLVTAFGQSQPFKLKPGVTLMDSRDRGIPYSYVEKALIGPRGDLYFLDTELSNISLLSGGGAEPVNLCRPRAPASFSDISADRAGDIWALDSYKSKAIKLNRRCQVQATFTCRDYPWKIMVNSFGEVVVLKSMGETLFDVYSPAGKLLRSFGERIRYDNARAESLLRNGVLVPDKSGGFYFSFEYPPLIRHYTRMGSLISEFRPESDVTIGPPDVKVSQHGDSIAVTSHYQVLVLDMTADSSGRLYLLISGKNKHAARTQGAKKLVVTTGRGKILKQIDLGTKFHRVMAGPDGLYLLKNRDMLRIEKYALP